jgi:flagellar basal-body rod protein FlgG
MIRGLYTGATGMMAQQMQIDTISNNIANANTIGFKKSRAEFADLMYQVMEFAGTSTSATSMSPTGIEVGLGVRNTAVTKMFTEGSMKETGNSLDVAITGNGFFQIQMPDGTTGYTRDGSFKIDGQGRVVNSDGYPVLPAITVPAGYNQINISTSGQVEFLNGNTVLGGAQIQIADFINPSGLHSLGNNLYQQTEASGAPVVNNPGVNGFGQTRQQFLEMSNVKLVAEMTDLITGQRAYDSNSKIITTADEMLKKVNDLKR